MATMRRSPRICWKECVQVWDVRRISARRAVRDRATGPSTIDRAELDADLFASTAPPDEFVNGKAPYFRYRETFSDYTVFEGLSYGGSRFIYPLEHQNGGSLPAFSVRVGYIKTFIRVHAKALAQFLEEVGLHLSPQYECDIVQILKFFSAIQAHFMDSKDRYEPQARREIKLFVVDLLLDEAIFSSVDEVQANQFWSTIRRSIRSHKAIIDLDSLRRALELPSSSGLTSDVTAKEVDHTDHHSPWISINGEGGNVDPRSLQLIKFRAYFYKGFSTLEQHQTSVNDLSRLQIPANRRNAWRLGFRVVRNLLRGQLPQDVRQVIFCVMMAHAMREGAECYKFTQEEFSRDLCRWRDALDSNEDRNLFERASALLFNEQLPAHFPNSHEDNLSHFQEVFQNLLSDMGFYESESDWHPGTPLSVIQARHAEVNRNRVEATSDTKPDRKTSAHRSEIYTENWKAHDIRIIKLAATVIFCVVIAVCLALYHPFAHAKAKRLMQTMLDGNSGPSEGHKRNCILIACYLGLSQHTIESIPFGSSSSAKSRPCHTCGRRITLGNFAKHLATHDPNKKYRCERCGHEDSRSDNFAKHDKSCRRRNFAQDLSEGANNIERRLHLDGIQAQPGPLIQEIDKPIHHSTSSPRSDEPVQLQQSLGIIKPMNPSLDFWPSYINTTSLPAVTAHALETTQMDSLPWQNSWTAGAFSPESNAAHPYYPGPELRYSFPPDQIPISPSSFGFDPNAWSSLQYNSNWRAGSREAMSGSDYATVSSTIPQAPANTTVYDANLNMQSPFNLEQFLDDILRIPDVGFDFSGRVAGPYAQGNPHHLPTASAPFLPFANEPTYENSLQSSPSGSSKRKSPSYPSDDGSDRATRVKTGYAGQSTWMDSFSS